jgi:hypothetical protein
MELYGLVSFIDEYTFGDQKSFRERYARLTTSDTFMELKKRLAPICQRTLRRQVLEYVKYTNRVPITQEFTPTKDEQVLYDMVFEYLRRDKLKALSTRTRTAYSTTWKSDCDRPPTQIHCSQSDFQSSKFLL